MWIVFFSSFGTLFWGKNFEEYGYWRMVVILKAAATFNYLYETLCRSFRSVQSSPSLMQQSRRSRYCWDLYCTDRKTINTLNLGSRFLFGILRGSRQYFSSHGCCWVETHIHCGHIPNLDLRCWTILQNRLVFLWFPAKRQRNVIVGMKLV